jgi:hypothetical protein
MDELKMVPDAIRFLFGHSLEHFSLDPDDRFGGKHLDPCSILNRVHCLCCMWELAWSWQLSSVCEAVVNLLSSCCALYTLPAMLGLAIWLCTHVRPLMVEVARKAGSKASVDDMERKHCGPLWDMCLRVLAREFEHWSSPDLWHDVEFSNLLGDVPVLFIRRLLLLESLRVSSEAEVLVFIRGWVAAGYVRNVCNGRSIAQVLEVSALKYQDKSVNPHARDLRELFFRVKWIHLLCGRTLSSCAFEARELRSAESGGPDGDGALRYLKAHPLHMTTAMRVRMYYSDLPCCVCGLRIVDPKDRNNKTRCGRTVHGSCLKKQRRGRSCCLLAHNPFVCLPDNDRVF